MNFKSLNESFEDKYIISKNLLVEEEKLLEEKKNSKKRLVESIDRPLNERDWKLTVPGNYRDAIFNAGEEEDFDGVRSALIDICNYVIENIDEADFDLDDQNYIVEEFEEFAEELDQVDFDGEDEANYYLNELYDLLDNTDIFLGLREAITEDVEEEEDPEETYRLAIIDWLYDHDQARKDIEAHTGVGIEHLSLKGLKAVISEHKQLAADFENHFNDSLEESLEEEKITGGNMEQEDINLIEPFINFLDELENNYKNCSFTWNFGRRNSDNKMTAGVDVYLSGDFDNEDSEDHWLKKDEEILDKIKDNLPDYGFKFDDSLGYDSDPWKAHAFGNGYHTQIIENVEEVVEESFGYKPSFDEWYFQETGVNTSDLTDEQYDELWADEDLMNHYRKFCDGLDESLNEAYDDEDEDLRFPMYSIWSSFPYPTWKVNYEDSKHFITHATNQNDAESDGMWYINQTVRSKKDNVSLEDKITFLSSIYETVDYYIPKRRARNKFTKPEKIPFSDNFKAFIDKKINYYTRLLRKEQKLSDESLNEEFAFRSNDELYDLDKEISDYLNQNDFHGMIELAYINPDDVPVPSITYEIHMGDWKHEHLFFKQLIQEFMDEKNIPYMMTEEDEDNGSDTYTAYHTIHLMKHKEDESLTEGSGSLTAFMKKSKDFHNAMNNFISTYSAEAEIPTYEVLDMIREYLRSGDFDYSETQQESLKEEYQAFEVLDINGFKQFGSEDKEEAVEYMKEHKKHGNVLVDRDGNVLMKWNNEGKNWNLEA